MAEHNNIQSLLRKPRYNNGELKKAVDIVVDELVPPTKRKRLDLVPRERFDAVVQTNDELNQDLRTTRETVSSLENQIGDLENELQQAEIDVDEAQLGESVAENRATALQDQFQQLNADFREALQKSIQEGINKLSLQAQNDGLRAELNALRTDLAILQATTERLEERLEGREADIALGGELLGPNIVVVNEQPNPDESGRPVRLVANQGSAHKAKYVAGQQWRVRNTGEETAQVRVQHTGTKAIVEPTNPTFALAPGEERRFELRINTRQIKDNSPGAGIWQKSKNYTGTLVFSDLTTGQSISFPTILRKRA